MEEPENSGNRYHNGEREANASRATHAKQKATLQRVQSRTAFEVYYAHKARLPRTEVGRQYNFGNVYRSVSCSEPKRIVIQQDY